MTKRPIPEKVRSYLARAWIHTDRMKWDSLDDGTEAIKYEVNVFDWRTGPRWDEIEERANLITLAVPGACIVKTALIKRRGYIWFTWSIQAMQARIKEIVATHGVADERVLYTQTEGKLPPAEQPTLPGLAIEAEPRGTVTHAGDRTITACYTGHGLNLIEQGFLYRIGFPNRGGLGAIPLDTPRVTYGDEWWLVGSRGDSPEVLEIEIKASPLDDRTKTNLLLNLRQSAEQRETRA